MEKGGTEEAANSAAQPPPPPATIPPNVKPERVEPPKKVMTIRPASGTIGRRISLLSNHFNVSIKHPDQIFYQYSVC